MADMYGPTGKAAGLAAALQALTQGIPLYNQLRSQADDHELKLRQMALQEQLARTSEGREKRMEQNTAVGNALATWPQLPTGSTVKAGGPVSTLLAPIGDVALKPTQPQPSPKLLGFDYPGTGSTNLPEGVTPNTPGMREGPIGTGTWGGQEVPGYSTVQSPRDPILERQAQLQAMKNAASERLAQIRAMAAQARAQVDNEVRMKIAAGHDRTSIANSVTAYNAAMANVNARIAAIEQDDRQFGASYEMRAYLAEEAARLKRELAAETAAWMPQFLATLGGRGAAAAPGAAPAAGAPSTGAAKGAPADGKGTPTEKPTYQPRTIARPGPQSQAAPGAAPTQKDILDQALDDLGRMFGPG